MEICVISLNLFQNNCSIILVYPGDCKNYYGPHSMECLKSIWNSSRCLPEGSAFPEKLTTDQHTDLDSQDIRWIINKCVFFL